MNINRPDRRNPATRGQLQRIEVDGFHTSGALRFRVVVDGKTFITCKRTHGAGRFRAGDIVTYHTDGRNASRLAFAR